MKLHTNATTCQHSRELLVRRVLGAAPKNGRFRSAVPPSPDPNGFPPTITRALAIQHTPGAPRIRRLARGHLSPAGWRSPAYELRFPTSRSVAD